MLATLALVLILEASPMAGVREMIETYEEREAAMYLCPAPVSIVFDVEPPPEAREFAGAVSEQILRRLPTPPGVEASPERSRCGGLKGPPRFTTYEVQANRFEGPTRGPRFIRCEKRQDR